MRKALPLLLIAFLIGVGYFLFVNTNNSPTSMQISTNSTNPASLNITSPAFAMNGLIPARFTCDGKNISPELNFSNIPERTVSLALTMEDPDVPKTARPDGMWNHWIVWNIPKDTTTLKEGSVPPGSVGTNTGGQTAYAGPCPPDREHRYFFALYALDAKLTLPEGATKEELLSAIAPHIIEKATLMGRYNRAK